MPLRKQKGGKFRSTTLTIGCNTEANTESQQKGDGVRVTMIIDPSDEISGPQITRIKSTVKDEIVALDIGSIIILTKIEDLYSDPKSGAIPHERERPRHPDDEPCDSTKMICDKDILKRDYNKFEEPLTKNLDSLLKSLEMERSPILEFLGAFENEICTPSCDQLWIVSDMLQHSPLTSLYESIPNFHDLEPKIRRQWGLLPKEIRDVTIWQPNRCPSEGGIQQEDERFMTFWNDYFTHGADRNITWEDIPIGRGCPEDI